MKILVFALQISIFILSQTPKILASEKSYIVCLGAHSHGLGSIDVDKVKDSHQEFLGLLLRNKTMAKNKLYYSYARHANAFAAVLEDHEAAELAKHPDVISITDNETRKLQTTRSWEFLGLEKDGLIPPDSIWTKAKFGEDVIIGNFDTGVWPESKSFSGEGFGPVPSKWKGICELDTQKGAGCNRKLIGARYFNRGYHATYSEKIKKAYTHEHNTTFEYFNTPRDETGHGTHTLSTAGGSFVYGANIFGHGSGVAKGGSPRARVASYKVCGPLLDDEDPCTDEDILAAYDAAIGDGVDVLSLSLAGNEAKEFYNDWISIGAFHAVKHGIVVVASAGNSGPVPGTVDNVAPWILTVADNTIDRDFVNYVVLGNNMRLKGRSLSSTALPSRKLYQLIHGVDAREVRDSNIDDALYCKTSALDPKKLEGKILVCAYNQYSPVYSIEQAAADAGAVGVVFANDAETANATEAFLYKRPASQINFFDGQSLFAYMSSTKNPVGYITPVETELGTKETPIMSPYSARGPNPIEPTILKPDITAPGEYIIAAHTQVVGATSDPSDERLVPFTIQSGTSMACPHVAGIVGLLKAIHPNWTPAAIKSAIMTTARTQYGEESLLDYTSKNATPLAYGAGHVQPNNAMDPGLVYDLTTNDYLNFLCAHGYDDTKLKHFSDGQYKCPKSLGLTDFNYPSITVPNLGASINVTRRVKNVGSPATYKVHVEEPMGISISVEPSSLTFEKMGEEKEFMVTMKSRNINKFKDYVFGKLVWSDGKHLVTSPVVIKQS